MLFPRYFEDLNALHIGTLPPRAYYIPCGSEESAMADEPRFSSDRVIWLNGEWDFTYFDRVYDVKPLWEKNADRSRMKRIPVPSVWQMHGYDTHQYINVSYPFPFDPPYVPHDNPCGLYIRTFTLDKNTNDFAKHINFEGVDSCYYLWINGSFVGYSQVSHSTSEFDISRFVHEGENEIAVLVLKWCDGSYLEDQDKFRMSGIFRDVYILMRPKECIFDYTVETTLLQDGSKACIQVERQHISHCRPIQYKLYAPGGERIAEGSSDECEFVIDIASPVLWNAESPALYTLLLSDGAEFIAEKIGLRSITISDGVIRLNGQRIVFHGVNRHDSDTYVGSAVGYDHVVRDLKIMKRHNINAIRTSHYPNAPYVTQLCDQYGFYVCDEADLEAHGVCHLYGSDANYSRLSGDPLFEEAWVDRIQLLHARDKNRPSVIMWSMGNEAGYGQNPEAALRYIKSVDITRLTHYERHYVFPKDHTPDYSALDVYSRMYLPVADVEKYCEDESKTKPIILCEYSHAMGNGPGDLEEYHQLTEKYDRFCGGFIWEWCDHTIFRGTTPDGRQKFHYGGDSGETEHDGNFCMDGLVYPDRRPHTGLLEYKNVIRPVRISENGGVFSLRNYMDFTVVGDAMTIAYELSRDGVIFMCGDIDDPAVYATLPHESTSFSLGLPGVSGNVSIRFIYRKRHSGHLVEEGHELGFDQIRLSKPVYESSSPNVPAPGFSQDDVYITIEGTGFRYVFNKLTGAFDTMVSGNRTLLEQPMSYNIWRAPTDNDMYIRKEWQNCRYHRAYSRGYTTTVCKENGCVVISTELSILAATKQRFMDITSTWTIDGSGCTDCRMDVRKNPATPFLPRFGIRMFLPESMDTVEYTGYGPYESYPDKHRASYYGRFKSSVDQMHEDYIKPQENGSRWGCDTIKVSGSSGGLTVKSAGAPISFNVSPYTQEMLTASAHNYELERSGHTVLCIDYTQSGVGSNSCGPQLLEKYRLNSEEFTFKFILEPGME